MVGDAVREHRADVLEAEDVDHQLAELVDPGASVSISRASSASSASSARHRYSSRTSPTHEGDGLTTAS